MSHEGILALVDMLGLATPTVTAMAGGRTNALWRVRDGETDLVLKVFDRTRGNAMFPNNPACEAIALNALAQTNLAPKLLKSLRTDRAEAIAYEHLEGTPLERANGSLLSALSRLHTVPPPLGLRSIACGETDLLAQGDAFLESLTDPLSRSVARKRPEPANLPNRGPQVFLHGDPIAPNAIQGHAGLRFIDWQCPAIGDPVLDIAVAMSPAMHVAYGNRPLDPQEIDDALDAYDAPDTIARYRAFRPVLAWRMACYCAWKAAKGEAIYGEAAEAELRSS
ncbi:aminoglycoside phosphotransferase family protein [Celeribacter arenosi]|uniref:Aminoglycoside phosphotransferase domain-containing protein n=1 Tax=Celeribacter arenosi TaxID=792649 RepID=A0ABP7JYB0_9RHOB